ncbi:MAG TPA: PEP-CTERM sorting domain-containing protein [Burkholderiales bacterium]|nr:PEP-CTERM sorting domain-containing protein [Burkholderiales bacterium]
MMISGLLPETIVRRILASTALSAVLFSALPAQAHLVEVEIRGHIVPPHYGTMAPGLEEGMPVFLEFVYESTTPLSVSYDDLAFYENPIVGGNLEVGPYTGTFVAEGSSIEIIDNRWGTSDLIHVDSYLDIEGLDDPYLNLTLSGPSSTWHGTALPPHFPADQLRDPSLDSVDGPGWTASIFFLSDGQGLGQAGFFTMESITSPVPEPGTWAVMLGGLAFTAFALQRRSKRH